MKATFSSIETLFERQAKKAEREKVEYDKLVTRILNAIERRNQRYSNEKTFFYPFLGLKFAGYHRERCIEYVLDELEKRDFVADFLEETSSFYISWEHYCPDYIRQVIRDVHGIQVDKYGRKIKNLNEIDEETKRKEEEQLARDFVEFRKRRLEESQFQQLQQSSGYDSSAVDSLRTVYTTVTPLPPPRKRKAGGGAGGNHDHRF
jgi:hypothetical protein